MSESFPFVCRRGEAGTPPTPAWFPRMIQRTGKAARLPFPVHLHMLRHRNLQSTACYTALAPDRFKGFWKD